LEGSTGASSRTSVRLVEREPRDHGPHGGPEISMTFSPSISPYRDEAEPAEEASHIT